MKVNTEVLEGNWNEIKGRLRQHWGQLSGDELDSAYGDVEQLVGTIQRKTGEARESVERYLEKLTHNGASMAARAAESVRGLAGTAQESVRDAAAHATDTVKRGISSAEETVQARPLGSLGVCFCAGLITGVVVGLLVRPRN